MLFPVAFMLMGTSGEALDVRVCNIDHLQQDMTRVSLVASFPTQTF